MNSSNTTAWAAAHALADAHGHGWARVCGPDAVLEEWACPLDHIEGLVGCGEVERRMDEWYNPALPAPLPPSMSHTTGTGRVTWRVHPCPYVERFPHPGHCCYVEISISRPISALGWEGLRGSVEIMSARVSVWLIGGQLSPHPPVAPSWELTTVRLDVPPIAHNEGLIEARHWAALSTCFRALELYFETREDAEIWEVDGWSWDNALHPAPTYTLTNLVKGTHE